MFISNVMILTDNSKGRCREDLYIPRVQASTVNGAKDRVSYGAKRR